MKLQGTALIKLEIFIKNVKDIAGTCFLTREEYDSNDNKICSFAHVTKNFNYRWNEILEQANIPIKRNYPFPIKQGRKPKDVSKNKTVECLRCSTVFISYDPAMNRVCSKCREEIKDDWLW